MSAGATFECCGLDIYSTTLCSMEPRHGLLYRRKLIVTNYASWSLATTFPTQPQREMHSRQILRLCTPLFSSVWQHVQGLGLTKQTSLAITQEKFSSWRHHAIKNHSVAILSLHQGGILDKTMIRLCDTARLCSRAQECRRRESTPLLP